MPGTRASYSALDADFWFRYSDLHEWCKAAIFLPEDDVDIIGVVITFRSPQTNSPGIWGIDYSPGGGIVDPTEVEAYLAAGIVMVAAEIPSTPDNAVDSRHQFLRLPDNWLIAARLPAFLKTNAANGRVTGSRSRVLPTATNRYVTEGTSGGADIAAKIALAPDGAIPYDKDLSWNTDPYVLRYSHRVGGAILFDLATVDFSLFTNAISSAAISFFAVAERAYVEQIGTSTIGRFDDVPIEDKLAASLLPMIELDLVENRHVGFFVNGSAQDTSEASYRGSGLTIKIAALTTGTTANAATVRVVAEPTKLATVKLVSTGSDASIYVYAEPDSGTNLADWYVGVTPSIKPLEFLNAGGTVIGTATPLSSGVKGLDTQKTFVTGAESLVAMDAAKLTGASVAEFTTPHRIDFSKLMQRARERIRDSRGLTSTWRDEWYLGGVYPAQISGDDPAYPYNPVGSLAIATTAWLTTKILRDS
jgi:hypothetical protein